MIDQPIHIRGAPVSPYTRKMLALLRYRRIAYALILPGDAPADWPAPRVNLLPTFYFRDAEGNLEAVVDSTPIIRRLEQACSGRSVVPPDPALRFLDELIEDYADEWLTKCMFHYRWSVEADIERAAAVLPLLNRLTASDAEASAAGSAFTRRQTGRLAVVGSNELTAPVIEESYKRLLAVLDAHIASGPFVFGARPASADFALFGQLTQLIGFDPTPQRIAYAQAPRVAAWTAVVDDLSGLEPVESDWVQRDAVPSTLRALLEEIGRVYAPALLANAAAVVNGAETMETSIDGRRWVARPFPYQAKCLQNLREAHDNLDDASRSWVDTLLAGTGVEALFEKG